MQSFQGESIDFSKSFCTWLLQEQVGYGRFSIEAILRVKSASTGHWEQFLLLAEVMAGHVYGRKQLIQEPVYGFFAIFSANSGAENTYKVFRTHFPLQPGEDTVAATDARFRKVESHVQSAPACRYREVSGLIDATLQDRPLVAHMAYPLASGQIAELIFPIKHMNVQPETQEFQVETGPLLLPPSQGIAGIDSLVPAYTAFNQFNAAEFAERAAVDLPGNRRSLPSLLMNRTVQARHFRFAGKMPVQIEIAALL